MADTKISALSSATAPLAGTEVAPIVQSGTTVKATAEQIATTTQPSGTANGVMYLNGSKIPTTGSTFNFNGSQLGFGVAGSSAFGFRQIYTGSGDTSQYGMYLDSYGDSSATGNIISIRAKARTAAAAFTCSTVADFIADTIAAGAGSTISSATGVLIADQTAGVLNQGLYSLVSAGTNKWNLYISGTASNYFNGGINVGSTADPGAGNIFASGVVKTAVKTVATLPSAATVGAGARSFVSDASAPVFGAAVVGGGAVKVPVYSTGTAWFVG